MSVSVLDQMTSGINRVRSSRVKIAVIATMRKVFDEKWATQQFFAHVVALKKDPRVEVITLDAIGIENGIIYAGELEQTERAIQYLCSLGIDAVLISATNYGDEEAAAVIASAMSGIPVYTYIWPDAPFNKDGSRISDNGCGIFPMRLLMRTFMEKVPGYFPFCEIGSDEYYAAWDQLIRVASGIRAAQNIRLFQVGPAEETFYAIEADPFDLRKRFGFRVQTQDLSKMIAAIREGLEEPPDWFGDLRQEIREIFDFSRVEEEFPQLSAMMALALGWTFQRLEETQSNCVSYRCWPEMFEETGLTVCALNSILFSLGIMAPCETDRPGVLASAFLHGLGLGDKSDLDIFADLTTMRRINDILHILWWHCGPFTYEGLRCRGECGATPCTCQAQIGRGWIFDLPTAGLVDGKWGEIGDILTLVQIRPDLDGALKLVATNGEICEGDETIGTHTWTTAPYQQAWSFFNTQPYDHHNSGRIGDLLPVVQAASPWLGLEKEGAFLDNVARV